MLGNATRVLRYIRSSLPDVKRRRCSQLNQDRTPAQVGIVRIQLNSHDHERDELDRVIRLTVTVVAAGHDWDSAQRSGAERGPHRPKGPISTSIV